MHGGILYYYFLNAFICPLFTQTIWHCSCSTFSKGWKKKVTELKRLYIIFEVECVYITCRNRWVECEWPFFFFRPSAVNQWKPQGKQQLFWHALLSCKCLDDRVWGFYFQVLLFCSSDSNRNQPENILPRSVTCDTVA